MPPPPPSSQPDGTGLLWVVIGSSVLIAFIWYFAHTYIVEAFFFLKSAEISLMQFFTGWFTGLETVKQFIKTSSPAFISMSTVSAIAIQVGSYFRYPIVLIMVLMAMILFSKNIVAKYSKTHTMKSLMEQEVESWPYTKIVKDLNLVDKNIHEGPWAVAITPMNFAKKYKLLQETIIIPEGSYLSKERKTIVSLLKSKAARIFIIQLGKHWEGIEALNDHTKALYAAFIAKAARDGNKSESLLRQFAVSMAEGQLDMTDVDEVIAKYRNYKPVVEITSNHAYVLTVMASMLQLARSDGVLPSAEFLWLKPVDRCLWFMLNAVGRQVAVVEVAGPFAHWLAEKEIGHKIVTPMVDQAVKALDIAIQEVRYIPEK